MQNCLNTYKTSCTSLSETVPVALPRLERVLDLSMMARLLGLLSTDLLANDMSAVTLVMDILQQSKTYVSQRAHWHQEDGSNKRLCITVTAHLPSNLCFRKSNSAFCIISVTCSNESNGWQRTKMKKEGQY